IIPWGQRWIVGTTDTDWTGDRAEPAATGEDIDYILEHANRILARPLSRSDVIGVYAGLRPLVAADDSKPTTKLSREHVVDSPVPGLTSIAGGKFTTYRLMARDVVDAAVADYDRWVPASVTDQLPLLGADGLAAAAAEADRLAEDYGVPRETVEHLLDRYGTLTEEVLELTRDDPALARPLADGHPYLAAEVAYAVTHEGALHVEDVLVRRVRLFIETGANGAEAVGPVSGIMGDLLGWDAARRAAETESYLELLEADTRALRELTSVPAGAHPAGARESAG
ncbi:MAG TPA: glycerol-3-phosphate dehydrogenase C-terminal domain-containing protein, partial [Streptosporangiaceae bacterium]|nr:glycerol-3-phosphate dehydrogenase C-terminal domain-containing protein [Streptosporangiaceae bacterium]